VPREAKPPTVVEPLPRGRHKLSREEVRASQRSRLLLAMLDTVEVKGFGATTVSDVVATAKVSRNAFYGLFGDLQGCFIEACDELQQQMLAALYGEAGRPTWLEALSSGLDLYLEFWSSRPGFATVYIVELPTAGRQALEQRDRAYRRFEELFEALAARARAEQPELRPMPELAPRLLVTAITEVVGQEVRRGHGKGLHDLRAGLLRFIATMIADEATADGLPG
jgi:AcrR family transcriptional regulator